MTENKVTVRVERGVFIIDVGDDYPINLTRDEALQLWDWLPDQLTRTFASGARKEETGGGRQTLTGGG